MREGTVGTESKAGRAGFTAIELIVVLVIIGIIVAFAFPKVNFTQFQVDAAARGVRSSLQNAERLAVTHQHNVVVSFDESLDRVRVLEDVNNNGTADLSERATWFVLEDGVRFSRPPVGVNGAVATAIVGGDIKTIDGMPSVIFRRDGASNTDLEVYLTSLRAEPRDFRAITVVQSTGRTDWFKYINAAWRAGNL
jgi:prepilin-type N-terminal cleavage/methylation domain-containing protein